VNGDWHYRLREHKGTLLALGAFVAMFTIYAANHPAGLNANVATTAANKGVLLAIVAMAQTLVVLTSGIDLSVGMVMVLANCLASTIVVGSPLQTTLGVLVVMLVGVVCGAINALIVIFDACSPSSRRSPPVRSTMARRSRCARCPAATSTRHSPMH
jgi:ribose transport system permease protein